MSDTFISTLEDTDSPVVLDYTSRDFTAIRAQLVGLAKGLMPEWETVGEPADFGTLILELFAYMGDVLHFYIDRTASEAFLGTAIRRQSVLYIADMLGYQPVGQQAASVTLQFTVDANAPDKVVIPVGTRVANQAANADDLIIFETNLEVTLDPTATPPILTATTFATEGVSVNDFQLAIAQGSPNTEYSILQKGVIYGSVTVTSREGVQVVTWNYVSDLSLARPTQAVFTTFLDDQGYTHIIFGDNTSGRVPPVNADIFVNYRYGVGVEANALAIGDLKVIVPFGLDFDTASGLTVSNTTSPIGGTDPETTDGMRQSIPRAAARIKSRAITLNDYADLALQVPGVAKSVAYGTVYTAVRIIIAPQGGQGDIEYMSKLCDQVERYMGDKVIVGSTVYVEPDDVNDLWYHYFVRVMVHVQDAYNRNDVRLAVEGVIRNVLAFDSVDFGVRISIGMVYRAALAVQGVEWAEVTWLSTEPPPTEAPVDTTGSSGTATQALFQHNWQHDIELTIADPGGRDYRFNNDTNPTHIALSTTCDPGEDAAADLAKVQIGDHIVVRQALNHDAWMSLVVIAAPVNNTAWFDITVVKLSDSGIWPTPALDDLISFEVVRFTPDPETPTGNVHDIIPPELLIPQIEPTDVIESEAEFPGMDEDERTHDGLWVRAVGGLVGT